MDDEEVSPKKSLIKNPLGQTGKTVAANVQALIRKQDLTYVALSARLEELGRQIPTLGLRKIVNEVRRIDIDDLMALAVALEVSPISLLMPPTDSADEFVTSTAIGEISARELFRWMQGEAPLPQQRQTANMHHTLPEWHIEEERALRAADIDSQVQGHFDLLAKIDALDEKIATQAKQIADSRAAIEAQKQAIEAMVPSGDA